MHCNLLDLPAELQLKIIEELLQDEDIEAHANNDGNKGDDDYKELQDEPFKIYHDLINWSCTCSYFRNLLAPSIFKTIKLVNDDKSGSSLSAVGASLHSVHVKELNFIGSALGDAHNNEAAFSDTERILPSKVDALLRDLKRFPSLERLSIEFDYNFGDCDEWTEGMDLTAEEETRDQVLEAEASEAWRALMSKTYFALAQNESPRFVHLEIRQLVWKHVSTFSDAAFHDFLSHLEQFTLSIHGEDNGAGWSSNVTTEYPALMGKLDEYFFNHLANVTTLSIKAPNEGPLGLEGMNHASLTLKADQMPLLKTLHLEYIFASPELVHFLVGHKDTLEKVTMRRCYASPAGLAENGIYWSELFTSLFSAGPTKLRHFELVDSKTPLTRDEEFGKKENEEKVPDEIREARTVVRQHPGRRLFPYAYLDDKYGMIFYDEVENLSAFLKGEDQGAWDRLMGLVEGNAKESTKSKSGGVKLQVQS